MTYITESTTRLEERAKLRSDNLAIAKDRTELNTSKLDSSLKKNTALIKKLVRNIGSNTMIICIQYIILSEVLYFCRV